MYFGAWVTIEDEDGKQSRYRIVGPDELDLKLGLISIDSPLARALIGKALDAEVRCRRQPVSSLSISWRSSIRNAQRRVISPCRATRVSCLIISGASSALGA